MSGFARKGYCLFLAICMVLGACKSDPSAKESWKEIYAQADRAYAQGDFVGSVALADRAAQRAREQQGDTSLAFAKAATLAGAAHLALAQYTEAQLSFEQALPSIVSSPGSSAEDRSTAYNNLAEAYREQGRYDRALTLYQQALASVEAAYAADSREVADATAALALAYHSQGELDRAEALYRSALGILDREGFADSDLSSLLGNMADLMWRLDRLEEAESIALRALAIETRELGPEHPSVAGYFNTLGVIYDQGKRYDRALESYGRALAIRQAALGPDHPSVATTHSNIAVTCEALKRYEQAEAHFVQAISIFESIPARQSDARANRRALAAMYRATNRPAKAEAVEAPLSKS
ncbi:tetratricopeptide repeat protein [Marilutibacter aestuarii]|uniref:tetratricopeptide repeat protein n=1 Tax=Marilutibacter aestuarii TaxID=1706195 RepID=UPI001477043A|nr:tetratricopeptide repeat protein [Lysobacter aestuarii]